MLTVEQIAGHFPPPLRQRNPRGMLVEYLQYELLDSLFKNPAASALSFIGGTAIRILHDSYRFSEDLDFDNFRLSYTQFEELLKTACRDMQFFNGAAGADRHLPRLLAKQTRIEPRRTLFS